MATATSNLVHDNSSLANFKAWAQFIFDAFNTTAGWTQTGDTGQTAPSAAGSVGTYYFLFNMADSLESSCPVFVKVTYGTNGSTVQFTVQVGQGSDGSGNLTGATTSAGRNGLTSNQGVSTFPCFASGDSGSIRILMWQSGSLSTGFFFAVERSKDATGANTADYVTYVSGDSNSTPAGTNWNFQSLVAGNPNAAPNLCTLSNGGLITLNIWNVSQFFNAQVAAFPCIPMVGYPGNPMLDVCGCAYQDVTDGATSITVTMYGGSHNFIAVKQNVFSKAQLNTTGQQAILLRYE